MAPPGVNTAVVAALLCATALLALVTAPPTGASCVKECEEGCELEYCDALLVGDCAFECPVMAPTCLRRCGLVAGGCNSICLNEGVSAACLGGCSALHEACVAECAAVLLPSQKTM